jgi:hypothetical protein
VHEERGVTGARVGEPALVQAGHHLGAEHARGLEQQAGQIGFAHIPMLAAYADAVNLLDGVGAVASGAWRSRSDPSDPKNTRKRAA